MKILNLYAGIGGNRKLWGDEHEITAVEYNADIANIYKELFPKDKMIVGDAHEYLLKHYKEFDFIWSSPPCPSHSCLVFSNEKMFYGQERMKYPDMKLYQEILLLKTFAPKETKWVVENVKPYYEPLIKAQSLHRHLYWSNFFIRPFEVIEERKHENIEGNSVVYAFDLNKYKIKDKRRILRNMVDPDLGLHILNCSQDNELNMKIL
jgi:DNA (cytosine-5)-methyltransferase 1